MFKSFVQEKVNKGKINKPISEKDNMDLRTRLNTYYRTEVSSDLSSGYILISNLLMLTLAILFRWSIFQIMLSFVVQNFIIGFFYANRILRTGINIMEYQTFSTSFAKKAGLFSLTIFLMLFFVAHYGILNWLYMVLVITKIDVLSWAPLFLVPVMLFIIPHLLLYRERLNRNKEEYRFKDIKKLMSIPYIRTIPMHIVIIPAIFMKDTMFTMILLALVKTAIDFWMNKVERKLNNVHLEEPQKNSPKKTER